MGDNADYLETEPVIVDSLCTVSTKPAFAIACCDPASSTADSFHVAEEQSLPLLGVLLCLTMAEKAIGDNAEPALEWLGSVNCA